MTFTGLLLLCLALTPSNSVPLAVAPATTADEPTKDNRGSPGRHHHHDRSQSHRLPGYSWDTLPVHWFSANVTSQFTASEARRIVRRHGLVILNGQYHAYGAPPVGAGAEGKMIEAGRLLKRAAADLDIRPVTVLAYFNAVLDWTPYDLHRWVVEDDASRALHDVDGSRHYGRTDNFNNTIGTFDLTNPWVRSYWVQTLVDTTGDPGIDGVFVDQADYDAHTHGAESKIDPAKLRAWHVGHRRMIADLRDAMPDGAIVLINNHNVSDFPDGYGHEYESFRGTVEEIESLQADAAAGRLATVHNGFNATFHRTLPAFLLGAGENAYYAAPFDYLPRYRFPWWTEPAWDERRPEYERSLGEPLGPAEISGEDGEVWTRSFASGTRVVLNVTKPAAVGGCVYWADGTVTGLPRLCGGGRGRGGGDGGANAGGAAAVTHATRRGADGDASLGAKDGAPVATLQ